MESLIEFGSAANAVTTVNEKMHCTTVRLLTKQELKAQRGLKGNAATIAYNDYLRKEGASNPERMIKKLASGELIVRSVKDYPGSMAISVLKRDKIVDPKTKTPAAASPEIAAVMDEVTKLRTLLKSLGATEADLQAASAGRLDPVPAAAAV